MAYRPPGAGERTTKVRFERRVTAEDGQGNKRGDWATLIDKRWVKLLPAGSFSYQAVADRMAGLSAHTLEMPIDSAARGVIPSDRVVDCTSPDTSLHRIYVVKYADVVGERKAFLLMQLEAVTGEDRV